VSRTVAFVAVRREVRGVLVSAFAFIVEHVDCPVHTVVLVLVILRGELRTGA